MTTQAIRTGRSKWAGRWVPIGLFVAVALFTMFAMAWVVMNRPEAVGRNATVTAQGARPATPPPPVDPLVLDTSDPVLARKLNAEIPFSTAPNPAARPFTFSGNALARERATDCLAAAMLYEAGDDPKGERAVGQVVLNRLRHPAFPKTVCGVVFQGEERSTGCQFTFTCDGAMARQPNPVSWQRARILASAMLSGDVYKPVGMSTHYHTDWVMPFWSSSLDKVTAVDTHLFFRWKGWWGTPGAFAKSLSIAAEPGIRKLMLLSPAHRAGEDLLALPAIAATLIDDSREPLSIGPDLIGKRVGPGKLVAVEPGGNAFVMTVDKGGDPARYAEAAQRLCAGRTQCRLLAWTDPGATPTGFPVAEAAQPSMSFSYLRNKDSGVERILYNCAEFPSTPRVKCMVRRAAAASPTAKLLADEQAERVKLHLPYGAKPAADGAGSKLAPAPTTEPARARLKADMLPGGAAAPAAADPS